MPTIIGISGSLRAASLNTLLLHALAAAAPDGTVVDTASIREFPLYDGDLEAHGIPVPVQLLKDRLAAADGLLIVTPEYNNSVPGVLKNAVDWLSRPGSDITRVFGGLPVALAGATPGAGSTNLAQAAWLPVLRTLGTLPWFGARLGLPNAGKLFDTEGRLTDPAAQDRVERFIHGFAGFVTAQKRSGSR